MNTTLKAILDPKNGFEGKVNRLSSSMGMDSAFYFTIGEFQAHNNDNDDDFFLQDEVTEQIIDKYPSLEF